MTYDPSEAAARLAIDGAGRRRTDGMVNERLSSTRPAPDALPGPLVVVSPHCDDAVLGCGELLAGHPGAEVVTVFAASPPSNAPLTPWDEAAGFQAGDAVMEARREEDRAALALLGAVAVWLEFRDAQYGPSPAPEDVARVLETVLRHARTVFIPLGLVHPDHQLTHAASLLVLRRRPDLEWFAYEDAIYRRAARDLVGERIRELAAAGLAPTPAAPALTSAAARKRVAIECYRSQLRALASPFGPGHGDAFAPEGYWRLTPS
jgi:LmbE family N-acetylglucosaminyl deacetylase